MKELTIVYLALTLIVVAGCSNTRVLDLDSPSDQERISQADVLWLVTVSADTLMATNARVVGDSLVFLPDEEVVIDGRRWRYPRAVATSDIISITDSDPNRGSFIQISTREAVILIVALPVAIIIFAKRLADQIDLGEWE